MTISIAPLMHTTIADSIYSNIVSKSSKYYYFLGKTVPYTIVNGVEQVETPLSTYNYELSTRREIISIKEITENDISFVIPRVDWTTGTIYDHYDDTFVAYNSSNVLVSTAYSGATTIVDANFYVLTDEYNLYICLDNNNNSLSTVKPIGYDTLPFVTADGYKWKFVMNIPTSLRVKFLTSFYIPVTTAINNIFYNNGAIDTVTIDESGSGYLANTTASITVTSATASVSSLVVGRTYAVASVGSGTNWNAIDDTLPIINFIGAGTTTVTGTVASTANYNPGDTIVIAGATGTEQTKLNGTWTIASVPTSTTFTFVVSTSVTAGTLTTTLGTTYKSIFRSPIVNYIGAGTTTIIGTVPSTYEYSVGDSITIAGATGTEQTKLNGTWTIASVPTSTTFTFVVSLSVTAGALTTNLGTTNRTKTYPVGRVFTSSVTSGVGTGTIKGTGAVLTPRVSTVDGQITRVDVTSAGSGYPTGSTLSVVGVGTGKFSPNTTALLTPVIVSGAFSYAIIVDPGLNYNQNNTTLTVQSDTGVDAHLTAIVESGQIVDIIIDNPGSSYRSANVTATGNGINDIDAKFTVLTSGGKLDTVQANIELLSVKGSIDNIRITEQGDGYDGISIIIDGDGTGATATATITNRKLTKINIISRGQDYTYANINIIALGSTPSTIATARAIMSPKYGHGKDAIKQLFSSTLMFYNTISNTNTSGFAFNNDYRQFGILKNPTKYESLLLYNNLTGTACYDINGSVTGGTIVDDMILTDNDGHNYVVVSVVTGTVTKVLLQPVDNAIPLVGYSLHNGSIGLMISSVTNPDIDKYSGDMLYIDNRAAFYQTEDQTVTLQTILKF